MRQTSNTNGETTVRLTTKGRYAVTAMLDLAYHGEEKPVTLTDIAKRQNISLSCRNSFFRPPAPGRHGGRCGGPGGGYQLSRDTSRSAWQTSSQPWMKPSTPPVARNCQNSHPCLTHDLWMGLSEQIRMYLSTISLHDLLQRARCAASRGAPRQTDPAPGLDILIRGESRDLTF